MPISDKIFHSLDFLIMLRRFLVVEPTTRTCKHWGMPGLDSASVL